MKHSSTILMTEFVTHDVKRFILTKPQILSMSRSGCENGDQWAEMEKWRKSAVHTDFTHRWQGLEFTIKKYPARKGVTDKLHSLAVGAKLLISDVFGTITYKGPGVFIAAGAGVTLLSLSPAVSSRGKTWLEFSYLFQQDTRCDLWEGASPLFWVTVHYDLHAGERFRVREPPYYEKFLKEKIQDFTQHFYVCGPIHLLRISNRF